MAIIDNPRPIEGGLSAPIISAGAPSAGTDEIQTITFGSTWLASETFKFGFEGFTTAAITWSATNGTLVSNIDTALEAVPSIGASGVTTAVGTMTSGIGTITVTFNGNRGKQSVPTMSVAANGSAAGTLGVTETTPGVDATGRGASKGAILLDTTNGKQYTNTGTALAPTWTVTGTQS